MPRLSTFSTRAAEREDLYEPRFEPDRLHVSGQAAQAAAQMNEILDENQKAITGGVDWYVPFVQNAAIHGLRLESTAALDWLDRAYAAGWRDGRTLGIDPLFASVRKSRASRSSCRASRRT